MTEYCCGEFKKNIWEFVSVGERYNGVEGNYSREYWWQVSELWPDDEYGDHVYKEIQYCPWCGSKLRPATKED